MAIVLSWQCVLIPIAYDITLSVHWLNCAITQHIQEDVQSYRFFSSLEREWSPDIFVSHFAVTGRIALLKRWSMESTSRYGGRQWSVSLQALLAFSASLIPRPSHRPVFDCCKNCKQSKTGRWEGQGIRLILHWWL